MNLYPHNQRAYEAAMHHFGEGNRKAAIIQPTGTGKSFSAGAVASHFDKVLVVAPNDYVLNQAKSTAPHADTVTYAYLSFHDDMPTGYDLIWFDEFHRIGAKTWRGGVDRLIEANPQAKILGTTATPDRALEQRNMADEFFDGDVVSNMTWTDAIVNDVLRVPLYVVGIVSMGSTQADYTERINNSTRINATQKQEATALLDNIVRDWSYSYGVPQILHKYIDNEVERMIVFAQTINKLDEVVSSIRPWFNEAGIKLANVYSVHSGMGSEAKRQMEAFENDTSEGIKVLVCVDMLNEGIHVDRVDAVMLLRSTISKNLYMQQIGRCFAVGQKHQPIILDLADNLTSACGYDGIYNAQQRYIERTQSEASNRTPDEFMIIDTLKETRELIAKIDKQIAFRNSLTFEEIKTIASQYKYVRDFLEKETNAYYQAYHKGWLPEITKDMISLKGRTDYTIEECTALAEGCTSRKEFKVKYPGEYNWMLRYKVHEIVFANLPPKFRTYTKEECREKAIQCKNRKDYQNRFPNYDSFARSHGWLDELFADIDKEKAPYINNKQYCIEWCAQFKSKAEAEKANPNITRYVYKHNWQDECFAHTISTHQLRKIGVRTKIEAFLKSNGRRPNTKERPEYNRFSRYEKEFPQDMQEMCAKYIK